MSLRIDDFQSGSVCPTRSRVDHDPSFPKLASLAAAIDSPSVDKCLHGDSGKRGREPMNNNNVSEHKHSNSAVLKTRKDKSSG